MKTKLFIEDLKELKAGDFNYKYAYNDRETGKSARLFGQPLDEVLINNQVCISGFLMSKFGFENTLGIEQRYGFSERQLECIIYANGTINFSDGTEMETPENDAALMTVLIHIKTLFKNENWLSDNIDSVSTENIY